MKPEAAPVSAKARGQPQPGDSVAAEPVSAGKKPKQGKSMRASSAAQAPLKTTDQPQPRVSAAASASPAAKKMKLSTPTGLTAAPQVPRSHKKAAAKEAVLVQKTKASPGHNARDQKGAGGSTSSPLKTSHGPGRKTRGSQGAEEMAEGVGCGPKDAPDSPGAKRRRLNPVEDQVQLPCT